MGRDVSNLHLIHTTYKQNEKLPKLDLSHMESRARIDRPVHAERLREDYAPARVFVVSGGA